MLELELELEKYMLKMLDEETFRDILHCSRIIRSLYFKKVYIEKYRGTIDKYTSELFICLPLNNAREMNLILLRMTQFAILKRILKQKE